MRHDETWKLETRAKTRHTSVETEPRARHKNMSRDSLETTHVSRDSIVAYTRQAPSNRLNNVQARCENKDHQSVAWDCMSQWCTCCQWRCGTILLMSPAVCGSFIIPSIRRPISVLSSVRLDKNALLQYWFIGGLLCTLRLCKVVAYCYNNVLMTADVTVTTVNGYLSLFTIVLEPQSTAKH